MRSQETFEEYRARTDKYSGMIRIGVTEVPQFEALIGDAESRVDETGLVSSSNRSLGYPINVGLLDGECQVGVVSQEQHLQSAVRNPGRIILPRHARLSTEATRLLLSKRTVKLGLALAQEEIKDMTTSGYDLLAGTGLPEFEFLSCYDTTSEKANELKATPPADIILPSGITVTSNPERINERREDLIKLHRSVFEGQAVSMGYYGGLSGDELDAVLESDEFMPILGIDQTNEAVMFTLFSPKFSNFDLLHWLNPAAVKGNLPIDQYNFTMPLSITSVARGVSLFRHATVLAGKEVLYRHKPDQIAMLYEANAISLGYTPRIINETSASDLGFLHQFSVTDVIAYLDHLD